MFKTALVHRLRESWYLDLDFLENVLSGLMNVATMLAFKLFAQLVDSQSYQVLREVCNIFAVMPISVPEMRVNWECSRCLKVLTQSPR